MKLSIVLAVRNEMPTLLGTLYSFYEDLLWLRPGDEFEFVVVDNCGTDSTAAILRDRMRRWVKTGLLRVLEFNERPGNVVARNFGAVAALGDVVIFGDGHLSIAEGLTRHLYEGAKQGGVWHPGFQMWGDTNDIRAYGYEPKLAEKFWGNISGRVPAGVKKDGKRPTEPYLIPMASHCCLAVNRSEFLDLQGYGDRLRVYGGGEPLLDMKYWVCGSTVHMEPRALVRHCAFGTKIGWQPAKKQESKNLIYVRREGEPTGRFVMERDVQPGDVRLKSSRDYSWTNEHKDHNFMAAAYIVGGYEWLQRIYKVFWEKRQPTQRYVDDLNDLRRQVISGCAEERAFVHARTARTLDDLLASPPWPT
jgi:glycosyltransferase involved in cell wall biosynthesis